MAEEKTPDEMTNPDPQAQEEEKEEDDTFSLIEKANLAADRLDEGNEKLAKLLKKQEALQVEQKLSGETHAGKPEETQEEKDIRSAKKLLEGTGFENAL